MKIVKGDLIKMALNGEFDVIVHGCNCFNTMGAGIAKQIKLAFPDAYRVDQKTEKGSRRKLGTYTTSYGPPCDIINAYTQYDYNGRKDLFEYEAFEEILKNLNKAYKTSEIGFPLIGCGLAGGNKERILALIQTYFPDDNCKVVVL